MKNIFSENSRYYKQEKIIISERKGQNITALKLRILPDVKGNKIPVKITDRLDIIAQNQFNDSTKFWYIADANTELDAKNLIGNKKEDKFIEVPTE